MKKLKVGIIGCGGIANSKHLPALTSQKDKCEIVAFCDITVSYTHLDVYKRQTSGSVTIRGKELLKMKDEELTIFRRRNIGFVFQNYNLHNLRKDKCDMRFMM